MKFFGILLSYSRIVRRGASGERRENTFGGAVERALVILPEAVALRDKWWQKDRALGFTGFAAQRPVRRSIPGDLILVTFIKESNSLPAAIEPGQASCVEALKRQVRSDALV
jgi:hypothetical protein